MIKLNYPVFWRSKTLISLLLYPLGYIYLFLGYIRKFFAKTVVIPQKVICVGNIVVGGAGKTQLVSIIARILHQKEIKFVIVTKAYGTKLKGARIVTANDTAASVGDESVLLRKFGQVIASRNILAAVPLIEQINPEVIILDDGMQNPYLKKDLQIVVFDPLAGIGNGMIFPAGPMREPLKSGLKKADLLFLIGNTPIADKALALAISSASKPTFKAKIILENQLDKGLNYLAFAAIANPDKFFFLLQENKAKLIDKMIFPDHHQYHEHEIAELLEKARKTNSRLITTEKDYIKIPAKYHDEIICAKVSLEILNELDFIKLIDEKIL